jgi:glycosyltransferase involved in cell wall biosynthesis
VGEAKTQLFESADVFAFPSKYREGFPYIVVEALAAGLPLVFTQVPALAEALSAQNGVGIPPADLSAAVLAQCIWELYIAPARRRAIAQANWRLAAERFSARVVCRQMEALYLDLAGQRHAP